MIMMMKMKMKMMMINKVSWSHNEWTNTLLPECALPFKHQVHIN